jgi:hypothetical protein
MKNLNKYYIKQKESELKKLDEKKARLSQEIEQENSRLIANKENLEKLQFENTMIKQQYKSLKNMIISRGIILDIENNNYNIKEWDNLFVEKKGGRYVVSYKNGEEVYSFEKDMQILLKDLFSEGYSCSLVVIRVTFRLIKIQLRFIKREE